MSEWTSDIAQLSWYGEVYEVDTYFLAFSDDFSRINQWELDPYYPKTTTPAASAFKMGVQISRSNFKSNQDWIWVYEKVEEKEHQAIINHLY